MSHHSENRRPTRRWMRDEFELVGLPPFEPSEALVAPRLWGRRRWTLRAGGEQLVVDVNYAPRGFLVVGRCIACGGRAEGLADLGRDDEPEDWANRGVRVGVLRSQDDRRPRVLTDVVERVTNTLRSRHGNCSRSPRDHGLAPMTERFVGRVVDAARKSLDKEGRVEGNLHLLLDDGRGCTLPTHQIVRGAPPQSVERNVNRAAAVSATRAFLRARDLRPVAAVLVSEAWMSEMRGDSGAPPDDDREEVVVVSVVTPEFGRVAYSPIEREGGAPERGSGRFGSLDWRPLRQPAPLVDGLFAGSDLVIERPDEVNRRKGVTLSAISEN